MEELALTTSMATLLMISVVCALVFKKLRMPAIIGYLTAGIIIANYWRTNDDASLKLIVDMLSNLGLALLMFTIGMELNVKKLRQSGAFAILAALVQLPILLGSGILLGTLLGWDFVLSVSLGAVMAGSSTAVVVVVQREKKVMAQDDVNTMILVLVIEDIIQVILLSLLTPMIKSSAMDPVEIVVLLAKIVVFMVVSIFIGLRFVPRLLDKIGSKTNREILLLSSLALCFFMAMLAVEVGISMAVGAFLMGVIVSQCRHVHVIEGSVNPLKDVFMAMFFISVGLKVKPEDIVNNLPLILVILVVFVLARILAGFLGYFIGNKDPRISFISATSRVTMGEFAFIISAMAFEAGVMSGTVYAAIIGAALVSMILQPLVTGATCRAYDGYVSREPDFVRRFNSYVMRKRADAYDRFSTMSQKSAHEVKMAMTRTYVIAFIVFVLTAVFLVYHAQIESLRDVLHLDIDRRTFSMIVEVIEFLILLIPLTLVMKGVSRLYYNLLTKQHEQVNEDDEREYVESSIKPQFLAAAFVIGLVIIHFVPNELGWATDILCAVVGIVVFGLLWLFIKRSENRAETEEELGDVPED